MSSAVGADQMVVMDRGEIVAQAHTSTLLTKRTYARVDAVARHNRIAAQEGAYHA